MLGNILRRTIPLFRKCLIPSALLGGGMLLIVNVITYFQLCLIANMMVTPFPMLVLCVIDIVIITALIIAYKAFYYHIYEPYNMVMIYGSRSAAGMKLKMDSRRDKYRAF